MRVVLLLSLLFALPASFAQGNASPGLRLVDWTVPVPKEWQPQPPSSNMRLAQFRAPAKAGPSEVAVFYFGPGGGGPVQANIERWTSQFTSPQGAPVKPVVSTGRVAGMPVTRVTLNGQYARGVGMGQEGATLPNQTLRVAVIETPKGNITFQMWGPKDSVDANWSGFKAMVDGIRPAR